MRLTEKQKKEFQSKVSEINSKDIEVVKSKIDKEIEKLKRINKKNNSLKIEELIENAELLNNILIDDNFPISDSSKKWMVFALKYLVSDIDLIPDDIPVIGYKDDSLLLSWIKGILKSDIDRYNKYIFLKKEAEFHKIFKVFKIIGNEKSSEKIILLPGLSFDNYESDNVLRKLLLKLREINNFKHSEIFLLDWDFQHLDELLKTFKLIDHQLKLKPVFDDVDFQLGWDQSIIEAKLIGKIILNQFDNAPKDQNIHLIALDVCTHSALEIIESKKINANLNTYFIGGTIPNNPLLFKSLSENNFIVNAFSRNDNALKFLNDYCDDKFRFCGISQISGLSDNLLVNIDFTDSISSHYEYRYQIEEILSKF